MTCTCRDRRSISYDFSQNVSSFVRSTAVCCTTFLRDLLLQLLNTCHIISAVTSLQASAQLEVACLTFCVSCVMSISLYRSTCLSIFCPRLLLLTSPAIPLVDFYPPHHHLTRLLVGGGGEPGCPTRLRVGIRLAHLLRHHRPHRRRSARG